MKIDVRILAKDYTDSLVQPDVSYSVRNYSWNAIGGPDMASVLVSGRPVAVWEFLEKLRYPIELIDERGDAVWWGFVSGIGLNVGNVSVGVDLKDMYNRLAVVYSLISAGEATVGTRATTTWVQDNESVTAYGTKELLASISGATTEQAESVRDAILGQKKYPLPIVSLGALRGGDISATLNCMGWWSTLGWKYYTNTNTNEVATSTQLSTIISGSGQFFSGVEIRNASGINSSEYRDGDSTALAEVIDLLRTGTTSGRRLLATVTRERKVIITEEQASGSSDHLLVSDGTIRDSYDLQVPLHKCPVGFWAKLKDVIPATVDLVSLASPSPVFIESAEYDPSRDVYTPEPRGVPSVWDLARLAVPGA